MHRTLPWTIAAVSVALSACSTTSRSAHRTALSARLAGLAADAPLTVAHRGASAEFPENTLPAFAAGVERGAEMVELDFRATADGTLVCMHDATLDRTTDATTFFGATGIELATRELTTIRGLDAGSWKDPRFVGTPIPTLEQALHTILPGAIPMVEHKDGSPEALLEVLDRTGLRAECLVQSFDWDWLERLRDLAPDVTLAALGSKELTPERLARINAMEVSMVHWNHKDLRAEDVAALHERGYLVCVYTVNDADWLRSAKARGLDAVTTDVPLTARPLFAAGSAAASPGGSSSPSTR